MAFGVEAVGGNSGGFGTITVPITVTAANVMLVAITVGDTNLLADVVAPTFNSVTMTAVASSDAVSANWAACRWYRLNSPSVGSFNVSVDANAIDQCAVHVVTFIDANTTLKTPSVATGTTANPSVTVADSASGNIVVAALVDDNESGATTEANTIIFEVEDLGGDTDHNSQYKTATGANTVMSWTQSGSGSQWAASALAVAPSGGGGPSIGPVGVQSQRNRRSVGRYF